MLMSFIFHHNSTNTFTYMNPVRHDWGIFFFHLVRCRTTFWSNASAGSGGLHLITRRNTNSIPGPSHPSLRRANPWRRKQSLMMTWLLPEFNFYERSPIAQHSKEGSRLDFGWEGGAHPGLVARQSRNTRELFILTCTPMAYLELSINLTCMFWEWGRIP